MLRILSIVVVLFGGAVIGLRSAELTLDRNVSGDLVRAGAWEMRVSESLVSADPYAQAERARSGVIPLASGEGFTLTARHDFAGAQARWALCLFGLGRHAGRALLECHLVR